MIIVKAMADCKFCQLWTFTKNAGFCVFKDSTRCSPGQVREGLATLDCCSGSGLDGTICGRPGLTLWRLVTSWIYGLVCYEVKQKSLWSLVDPQLLTETVAC